MVDSLHIQRHVEWAGLGPSPVQAIADAYRDPKRKMNTEKGPRSKHEQKTPVEPLSITYA